MYTDGEAIWVDLLGSLDIDVPDGSGRCGMEMRVMGGKLAAECYLSIRINFSMISHVRRTIHTTSNLTSLLVTPANGCEVCFVVQETTVEEWLNVGAGRLDVDLLDYQNIK